MRAVNMTSQHTARYIPYYVLEGYGANCKITESVIASHMLAMLPVTLLCLWNQVTVTKRLP